MLRLQIGHGSRKARTSCTALFLKGFNTNNIIWLYSTSIVHNYFGISVSEVSKNEQLKLPIIKKCYFIIKKIFYLV